MGKFSLKSIFIVLLAFVGKFDVLYNMENSKVIPLNLIQFTVYRVTYVYYIVCCVGMISVTVEIVEAKRLLHEETTLPLLHLEASPPVEPLGWFDYCQPECKELCFYLTCYCVCPPIPKI